MSTINTAQTSATAYKRTIQGSGVVDSQGNCRIDFPLASTGVFLTGSITIYDSPPSAIWMKLMNNQIVDTVVGQSTCANIQISGLDKVSFITSGLTGFIGTVVHATFFAIESPANNTNLVIPGHDSLPPVATYVRQVVNGINYTVSGGPPHNFNVPLLASDQSLIIGVGQGSGPATFTVTGVTTGLVYITPWILFGGQSMVIPAYGQLDSSVNVSITGITSNAIITIAATPNFAHLGSIVQPLNDLDQNGPDTGIVVSCAASTNTTILAAPPANTMNRIVSAQIVANTTAAAVTFMRIFGGSSNASLITTYPTAGGTSALWVGSIGITESLIGGNGAATAFNAHVWYRNEPI